MLLLLQSNLQHNKQIYQFAPVKKLISKNLIHHSESYAVRKQEIVKENDKLSKSQGKLQFYSKT